MSIIEHNRYTSCKTLKMPMKILKNGELILVCESVLGGPGITQPAPILASAQTLINLLM